MFKMTDQRLIVVLVLATVAIGCALAADPQQPAPRLFGTSRQQKQPARPQRSQPAPAPPQPQATGTAVEVAAPVNAVPQQSGPAANRTTRTADVFQNGDGYNIFVTNTCERDSMKVNIKTSRPFYGVIHTRGQRQKQICNVEGNGDTEYNIEISHALNPLNPSYCGVIKARRESPEDKDILSVVIAVRVHRNIELSDDKFFLLNCTNRCRRPDCSSASDNLVEGDEELTTPTSREREAAGNQGNQPEDECTIWKFPWVITLLWCLGILLLAMIISHCIMCSSMVCRCVKTEVEEREPSEYEGASDFEDSFNKRNPYQIDYDNREIYKTSNNYAPYNLEEVQTKSRQKNRRR